jgi:hypothetical protein
MDDTRNSSALSALVSLVKSLTQAQKRDFKKYTRLYGGTEEQRYVVLVDKIQLYLAAQKEESALQQYLMTLEEFRSKNALNAVARYAFEKILDSVRTNPEVSPRLSDLYHLLQDINFLFYKGLYEECYDLVTRGLALARQLNRATLMLEFLHWDRRIYALLNSYDATRAHFSTFETGGRATLRQIGDEMDFQILSNRLYFEARRGQPLSSELAEAVNFRVLDADPAWLQQASPMTRIWRLNCLFFYYELQYRLARQATNRAGADSYLDRRLECLQAIVEIFHRENRAQLEDDPYLYNGFLDNYLSTSLMMGRLESLRDLEEEFKAGRQELFLVRAVAFHRLQHWLLYGEFEQACAYIETQQLKDQLERYKHQIDEMRLVQLYFCGAQSFYLAGYFEEAADWFRQIYNRPRSKGLHLYLVLSELLMFLCQYQTNSKTRIAPVLRTMVQQIRRQRLQPDIFLPLLDGIKLVVDPPRAGRVDRLPAIIEQAFKGISQQKNLLVFGNVLAWIEARVNGTTITQEIAKYNKLAQA